MKTDEPQPEPKRRGRPKGARPALKSIVNFKATPEYAEWLKAIADAERLSHVTAIEEALKLYAKARKHGPPPSRTGDGA